MGQKASMYDLAWSIEGDSAEVEQGAGFGEVSSVTLHKSQLRLLATEMGLLHGDANAWQRVATLERRLCLLRDRIAELDRALWSVGGSSPSERPPTSDCVMSDHLATLADEFCADLGLEPDADAEADGAGNANAKRTQCERIPASSGKGAKPGKQPQLEGMGQ